MMIKKDWLTIGEVSAITDVPIHTLRYWEGEFNGYFRPLRTSGRQRRYDEDTVQRVLEIKSLLKEEKYSIAGAKQVLARRDATTDKDGVDYESTSMSMAAAR